ncbi:hypothetical protein SASPL_104924 [Salvia splendens]|uniref:FAS1 domain-containing protein n=1 Tax=Salvia splendens TaxID=180675 RepID=A0A8X8YKC8_SALSN|nr:uncharacterized protein LOC121769456 [Salvia splendens]KAG6433315.1 hypothetical protein SASPL_104924 [Salvia splendens]
MRRRKLGNLKLKNRVKLVCAIVTVSFLITQIFTAFQLIIVPRLTTPSTKTTDLSKRASISEFGETVIKLLPEDLAFTLFLPSEEAIRRDLRLKRNDSDSYAVLTRVMGFSSVPRWISSGDLEIGKEKSYDSISGLSLRVSKDLNGNVVVNGVVSEEVDLRIGEIIVHVMDGVVMDAEFEQSLRPDDDDDDFD